MTNYWRDGVLLLGATAKTIIDNRKTPDTIKAALDTVWDKIWHPLG